MSIQPEVTEAYAEYLRQQIARCGVKEEIEKLRAELSELEISLKKKHDHIRRKANI